MAEHMLEMAGALVRVRDGEIEVLTDPKVRWCPLRSGLYGHGVESRKTVESVLRGHMVELGMYGPHRVLELSDRPVSFGASEMIADAMRSGARRRGSRGRARGPGRWSARAQGL